ncbi:MAG: hypothetical protein IMF16_06915 [Proteobacteria bacterium]|nr:hypothetical protein [Pseudomonadota bacterium]
MPRAVWACLILLVCLTAASSSAWAVERGLAGVRLGDNALSLLSNSNFGQPNYIGPIGSLGMPELAPVVALGASGPSGPGGRGGAQPASGVRASAPDEGAGMYWYYRRPGGVVLVLTLSPMGEITALTLTGTTPYAAGRTTRNIGLSSGYMEIIAQYGYPDQVVTIGSAVEMTYVDHGVRFHLQGMRVTEIAIGVYVTAAVEAAPSATPEVTPPPAGLTVEELRGYL